MKPIYVTQVWVEDMYDGIDYPRRAIFHKTKLLINADLILSVNESSIKFESGPLIETKENKKVVRSYPMTEMPVLYVILGNGKGNIYISETWEELEELLGVKVQKTNAELIAEHLKREEENKIAIRNLYLRKLLGIVEDAIANDGKLDLLLAALKEENTSTLSIGIKCHNCSYVFTKQRSELQKGKETDLSDPFSTVDFEYTYCPNCDGRVLVFEEDKPTSANLGQGSEVIIKHGNY